MLMGRCLGGVLALLVLAGSPAAADTAAGRAALRMGHWTEAEQELKAALPRERGAALLALGELYLVTGRHAEALQQATQASQLPAFKARALTLMGEAQRETGRTAEAVRSFQAALAADPRALRARAYLGISYRESGQDGLAQRTLQWFVQEFNAGRLDAKSAEPLFYTALAARHLEGWEDANETFQDALTKEPQHVDASLEWGDLFLLKYRADEAQKCFVEVLKVNPQHPAGLVGMARVRVEAAYDVEGAGKLADQALKANPRCVPALALKARLALDDEQFAPAEALLRQALAVNPVDPQCLALLASSRYLQEDNAGYEAQKAKALRQNPRFSGFYFTVAELAVRHHRYAEAVALNRQALALDPQDADALASAGINLLRQGIAAEPEALKLLDQAFKRDGFNVRTFNTLNLYEEVISKEYETVKAGSFLFRLSRKERPLLERYVPALMQRAWDLYAKKYGFTPPTPITVELFTERQHYGARTTGLPEIGAQGTCFGPLITAMSPASAEASWEQVLWHELAHVFHLQLSRNRAPRWFTEGLSEYETNLERPYWKREHARDIYRSLQAGDLWKIEQLSAAFTHPDRENGVVIAYQQSSLVIHYLAESCGFPKLVEALKLYGAGKRDDEVLPAISGKSMAVLNEEFRRFLQARYRYYADGFDFDPGAYKDGAALKRAADAAPSDAAAQARFAAALLAGPPPNRPLAVAPARKALALEGKNVLARYVLAQALLAAKDAKGAREEFDALLAQGTDGYQIRLALGTLTGGGGDEAAAERHLAAAAKWDPDRAEPYALLAQLYEARGRRPELLRVTESLLDIEEHDHDAARLLIGQYANDAKWAEVERLAPRVIGITPMEAFVHQQYGQALAELKRPRESAFELESALAAGVRRPAVTRALLARQYLLAGDRGKARLAAEQALKEDPANAEAAQVLKDAAR